MGGQDSLIHSGNEGWTDGWATVTQSTEKVNAGSDRKVSDKEVRSVEAPPRNLQDLNDLLLSSRCQIPQHTIRGPEESRPQLIRAALVAKVGD